MQGRMLISCQSHIPAWFGLLKLLGFWFQPTSLGSVGCRNHGTRGWEAHMASQCMESGLGLFRRLIKHSFTLILCHKGKCSA